jgi:hypothetical protein
MPLVRGAVLPLPSGCSASNPVVSSNPSVSDGYFTLVQFFPHPCSLPSYPSLFTGCGVLGFALSTIPKVSSLLFFFQPCTHHLPIEIHYHVLLVSTAFAGATSFMLGVDCFTTAGLKEVFPSSPCLFFHLFPSSFMYGILVFLHSSQNSSTTEFSFLYHKLCRSNSVSSAP